uniref:Poly(A)-specific ribonuclease PARN n=1 Tax=Guillardia theta TaxID=55529 RepID=A0A7S4NP27_GUITH|mmetsp:Transcript_26696/g.87543  ORF Transcript_26696/g.87543 Transcript_26696/m.87543 type:complete len:537 (+) Transcript_26696:201-1811(+)
MDVTTENFEEVLREIKPLIDECDFLAIDCEFTGLDEAPATAVGTLQSVGAGMTKYAGMTAEEELQSRYEKIKASTTFLVVQVGICVFTWNAQKRSFIATPYNFYTFPREFKGLDRRFLCQAKCMSFLSSNCMDFNKLIKSGISYLNKQEEEFVRRGISSKETEFVATIRATIAEFLADETRSILMLPQCDSYRRMLIHRDLSETFDDCFKKENITVEREVSIKLHKNERTSSLGTTKAKIMESISSLAQKVEEKQIQAAVGFRHVIDHISASKKLIVGHNMLLDMAQIEAHFCRDLPTTYEEFKRNLHERFPLIVDTKCLTSSDHPAFGLSFSGGTRLDAVFRTVMHDPFKRPIIGLQDGCDKYKNNTQLHEAGYDAYITGFVFLRTAQQIVMKSGSPSNSPQGKSSTGLTPRLKDLGVSCRPIDVMIETLKMEGLMNKIHVMGGQLFHSLSLDDSGDNKMATSQDNGSIMGQMEVVTDVPHDPVHGSNGKGLWQIATSRSRNGKFHARDSRRPRQDSFEGNHAHKGQEKRPRMSV